MSELVVVDYGSGNLRSIVNALTVVAAQGQRVVLSGDPGVIAAAERIVLPGVGAFAEVRRKLTTSGLIPSLNAFKNSGRPLLGICVGMQIMADEGSEFGHAHGLGWVPGAVTPLEPLDAELKLPHIGWSAVTPRAQSPLFESLPASPYFYFVHSFALSCSALEDVEATAHYGVAFTAAVRRANVVGTQFHPERSSAAGLAFLANFCRWSPS
ncbi:MAG: imidazole glycerol phosphate synthase subunit HisH [Acidobacteria bacterium]|nr:imidazole glycerol phosphate synthase subunit HisH [Acidobacteriota bacterium]